MNASSLQAQVPVLAPRSLATRHGHLLERGPVVLEVNSSPCMPYPDLPGVDLAAPMLRAVLDWMEAPSSRRII